jgi:hypothetical protein
MFVGVYNGIRARKGGKSLKIYITVSGVNRGENEMCDLDYTCTHTHTGIQWTHTPQIGDRVPDDMLPHQIYFSQERPGSTWQIKYHWDSRR